MDGAGAGIGVEEGVDVDVEGRDESVRDLTRSMVERTVNWDVMVDRWCDC